MTKRTSVLAAAAVSALAFGGTAGPWAHAQQKPKSATPGDAALAARFADLARESLRTKTIAEPSWRASAAMLQAANRLDPGDARYPRLLVDARLQAGDRDGAIDAIKAWLRASPANVSAQTQLIDLYLLQMESADAKVAYLLDIVGKPPVGDLVRSHAAARAARVMLERSENERAIKTVAESLRLNPLNLDALMLRMQMVSAGGTPLERTAALLALLRANPAQPQVMAAIATQVADVGLAGPALEWYSGAGALGARMGVAPSPQFVTGYVSQLFVAGHVEPAQKLATQILAQNPSAVDVWFLKLTMDKATSAPTYDESKKKAGVALSNRLAEVRSAAGRTGATTRPVDAAAGLEVPDLAADLNAVKTAGTSGDAVNAYVSVLADIAWYQAYYLEQAVAPGILDFLRQTLPPDSVTLARVEGWNALAQGKGDDAKVKLSAVADRDPLSKLGVIRLGGPGVEPGNEGRKLVNDNPSGLLGAMLWGGLKDYKGVDRLTNPHAEAIQAEIAKFPRDLLKVLDTPQEFYAIRGEPAQIAHGFGEPLYVDVTIQNMGDFDLTVGPGGLIRPDLWFDARLRGGIDQQMPAAVYERIADAGVLRSRQAITQRVRIDQDTLSQILTRNPAVSVQVYTGVMTNPQPAQNGLSAGPGGYRVQFPRVMERQATPIGAEPQRTRIYNQIANGNGSEKIRAIEVLATYVQLIRFNKDAPKEALPVADEMTNAIRTGMSDAEPGVQAWAAYMAALVGPPDQLPNAIAQMMTDKSWQKRLLALTALPALTAEQRKQLPNRGGLDDADPVVAAYAKAAQELAEIAATQPATRPAESGAAPSSQP
jgi:tetratricopeptide (TPR) repeat protein